MLAHCHLKTTRCVGIESALDFCYVSHAIYTGGRFAHSPYLKTGRA